MDSTIVAAVLALLGTMFGSFAGIMTANKLVNYRIEQLEKKVDKHNNVLERVYVLEKRDAVEEEEIKGIKHRVEDLEGFHKPGNT